MKIPFVPSASERGEQGLTDLSLQNFFPAAEPALLRQLGRQGPAMVDAPGSRRFADLGASAVRGLFYYPSSGSAQVYALAGTALQQVSSTGAATAVTTISGTDLATWDTIRDITLLNADGKVWSIVGAAATQITDVDLGTITAIAAMNGRLIAARDASDSFVWSDVLSPGSIGALSFSTAETYGDKLIRPFVHQRRLHLFGEASLEIFQTGPSSGQAFVRMGDAVEQIGLGAKYSLTAAGPALCFVGVDRTGARSVLRFEGGLERISDAAIEERLAALSEADFAAITGSSYSVLGQTFYQIDLPGIGTYAMHFQSGAWLRRKWGSDTLWRGQVATNAYGKTIYGSRTDGKLYALDPTLKRDDVGGTPQPLERIASTFIGVEKNTRISSLAFDCGVRNAGVAPMAQVAISHDDGETWLDERPVPLAQRGARSAKARNWPMARAPGLTVKSRFLGDHALGLTSLLVNEPGP